MAFDLSYWLQPALDPYHTYGLFFLLGSFSVATLSDLKRMSAQNEFLHVWVLAVLVFLGLDFYQFRNDGLDRVIVKWALIAVLSLLCWHRVGLFFKLAHGDVFAIAAVCGLLSPVMVILFFLILKVVNLFLEPVLHHFGTHGAYPFMPVVMASTAIAMPTASYLQTLQLVL